MSEKLPLISVIIPVYNTSRYLKKCVDSIVNQTYTNLEIILIDDGSTDHSGKICDDYAREDSRMVVIHKENSGLAHTRNTGMAIARGEYMMFVDSDDWVDPDMCEILVSALYHYNVQVAMCSYVREYPDRSLPKYLHSEDVVFDGRAFQRRLCGPIGKELSNPENLHSYNMMWGKLYPSSAIRETAVTDIREIGPSEDLLFNVSVFSEIENIVYVRRPCYHYRKDVDHSIVATYKKDLEEKWSVLYSKIKDIIEADQLDESYYTALNNRIALGILSVGLNCISDNAGFFEKYQRIKKATADVQRKAVLKKLSLKDMPLHWKIFYFSARHRLNLLVYVLLVAITKLKGKI